MNVIQHKVMNDEDLNLFDESDWDFLNVKEGSINFQFFEDVPDTDFTLHEHSKFRIVLFTILSSVLGVLVAFCFILGYQIFIEPLLNLSTEEEYQQAITEVDNSRLKHITGTVVDSSELISVSGVFNNYFYTVSSESNYSDLHNMCLSGSNFAETEERHRTKAKESYDTADCYSRALREFSSYISLDYIDEVVYKDGVYYCYVVLNIPDSESLFDYFMGYKYEMTKFFQTHDLDQVNVTRCLLSLVENNNVPLKSQEYLFKVSKTSSGFVINDDAQVTNICTDAYNLSISNITQILGGTLVRTQYE